MTYWIEEPHPLPAPPPAPRLSRNFLAQALSASLLLGLSVLVGSRMLSDSGAPVIARKPAEASAPKVAETPRLAVGVRAYAELMNPAYSLGAAPVTFVSRLPRRQDFAFDAQPAPTPAPAAVAELSAPLPPVRPVMETAANEPDDPEAEVVAAFPVPPPRPVEFAALAARTTDKALRRTARAETVVPQSQPAGENRGFFEKLFGGSNNSSGQALAYAAPEDSVVSGKSAAPEAFTAVYDISARTVTLPSGAKLEAHSGLGEFMDDPRGVHLRMRGATPPALYDLKEREALFHGVRALRLTPINSSVHGRSGLLAHTFMLGPSGQSNGCVSFRNYDAFLQAYLRGEVKRLMVVSGGGNRWASR
jgi:hypothetical protein